MEHWDQILIIALSIPGSILSFLAVMEWIEKHRKGRRM